MLELAEKLAHDRRIRFNLLASTYIDCPLTPANVELYKNARSIEVAAYLREHLVLFYMHGGDLRVTLASGDYPAVFYLNDPELFQRVLDYLHRIVRRYIVPDLKTMVKGQVKFVRYQCGELWYVTENGGFEFPVPVADTGTGVFKAEDKGILFMRYIRKHIECLEEARAEASGK